MGSIIDLSVTLEHGIISEEVPPKIRYINHKTGAFLLGLGISASGRNIFCKLINLGRSFLSGKLLTPKDFPQKRGLSTEIIRLGSHTGTHVDAPYHYGPDLPSIEEADLEVFFSDGVLLDFSDRPLGSNISYEEVIRKLSEIDYRIKPNDIILIRTGSDCYWGTEDFTIKYFGLSCEALSYFLELGVRLIGTDAFGLDAPFREMHTNYFRNGNNVNYLWPAHFYGRKKPYYMIEKLTNLSQLPKPYGFKIAAFPIKIKKSSASWARVVAICD